MFPVRSIRRPAAVSAPAVLMRQSVVQQKFLNLKITAADIMQRVIELVRFDKIPIGFLKNSSSSWSFNSHFSGLK